jgi:hypothetical protein
MKKLLIGLLALSSLSTFASTDCDTNLDMLTSVSSSQGASKALLIVQTANSNKFKVFKTTLEKYPNVNEIGGYTRDSLEEAILDNEEALNNLKNNIASTTELLPRVRVMVKDGCLN